MTNTPTTTSDQTQPKPDASRPANTNCLEGVRCPQCGNEHRFLIVARIMANVTDDGAEVADHNDWDWDDDSFTVCPDCDRDGALAEFRVKPPRHLPPDPEGKNDDRAGSAGLALLAFQSATGSDDGDSLADLLCDLMHLCDRNESLGGFDAALDRTRSHYEAETVGELGA